MNVLLSQVIMGFQQHVRPYLDDAAVEQMRQAARARIDPRLWSQGTAPTLEQGAGYQLAAVLGLHRELAGLVSSWPDNLFTPWGKNAARMPHEMIFGLGDAYLVEQHFRRLRLPLRHPLDVRAWLAHTGTSALDWVVHSIRIANPYARSRLIEALCLVRASQAARPLLELHVDGFACVPLQTWLHREVGNAVAGLLPLAAGRGRLADAARAYLRTLKRRGLDEVISGQLGNLEPAAAGRIRSAVLDTQEVRYQPFDHASPIWLRQAFAQLPALPNEELAAWVDIDDLPPLVFGERCLNPSQVQLILHVLQATKLDSSPRAALISALRTRIAAEFREAFAWRLVEQWQGVGAPPGDTMALAAVGFLGSDDSVLRLAELIRDWSSSARRAQAVLALDCLRALDSPLAVVQLANLSRQLKGRPFRERARKLLGEVAGQRGLSVEALEDRAVPSLGFRDGAGPIFDFGSRRFQAILMPGPRLALRDETGRLRQELPASGARDDREQATKATAAWRALKRQLREVVKEQAHRLERSMVGGQRFAVTWFTGQVLRHPVLVQLARLLLWGGYDERARLALTFRVNEEQVFVDADESPVALTDLASVRIVHPIELSESVRSRWLMTWSDHELIPPFAQLGRRLFHLTQEQQEERAISWFSGRPVPALTLASLARTHEWLPLEWDKRGQQGQQRGKRGEQGQAHCKVFRRPNLTAVLYHPDVGQRHYPDPLAEQDLSRAFFLRGQFGPKDPIDPGVALPLAEVDTLTLSEVCELLALLQSKGKE
jgi:hypothetical protein